MFRGIGVSVSFYALEKHGWEIPEKTYIGIYKIV